MAEKRRRRRRIKPVPVIVTLFIIAAIVVGVVLVVNKYGPSGNVTDLDYYYNLTANEEEEIPAAEADELAIVLEELILKGRAIKKDDEVYVPYTILKNNIDTRIHYDVAENLLLFTNAAQIVEAHEDDPSYTVNGASETLDHPAYISRNNKIYISMDFITRFIDATYAEYTNPRRVVIQYTRGDVQFVEATRNTEVRVRGGIKANVVGTVEKGSKLKVIEHLGDWVECASPEGWVGYVNASHVTKPFTETVTSDYTEPEYTHKLVDGKIVMGWAGIYSSEGNGEYSTLTSGTQHMNVYSPTWYSLMDGEGAIQSFATAEAVEAAHNDGRMVWALFGDAKYDFSENVLTHTSIRRKVIDWIMEDINALGIDGINIDFECIKSEYGGDYIQFIRELSVACRQAGKYLSVDNYTPYDFNACYHIEEQIKLVDYVVVMSYDDYVGSGNIGPNCSTPFLRTSVDTTISKIEDSSRLIVGLPFYSRFWFYQTDENGDKVEINSAEFSMARAYAQLDAAGIGCEWDAELGCDYAHYAYEGEEVDAWLEGSDAFRAKLDVLSEYSVAGISTWQLGQEKEGIWDMIAERY
ncbi:MAG: hypothetical protein HUJ75_07500 [Parasporobacterium sp.]|nr:hypothetical protein [Parasporobacterium sp.]